MVNQNDTESAVSLNRGDDRYAVAFRLNTFARWRSKAQQSEKLAEAGFVYTGHGDRVRCFFCNGVLRDWQPNDEPWVEHARWFPDCAYIRRVKGDNYVKRVHQLYIQQTEVLSRLEPHCDRHQDTAQQTNADEIQDHDLPRPDLPMYEQLTSVWRHIEPIRPWDRERDHPQYSRGALLLCQMYNIARAAVRVVIEEVREGGLALTWDTVEKVIVDRIEGREVLPVDPPDTNDVLSGINVEGSNMDRLVSENRRLLQFLNCNTCGEREARFMLLPCSHISVCQDCVANVCQCPVCHTSIKDMVKVYWA